MPAADQRSIIDRLRHEIEQIEHKPVRRRGVAGTGRPEIDALLPGRGFPRGALSEIAGGPASGKTGLVLSAMAHLLTQEGLAAFVDGRHELYPPAAWALGVDLARLLIVRPGSPRPKAGNDTTASWQGLWAAELLLASGSFEVVAVDVPLHAERLERVESALRRLQAAAEKGGAVALWLEEPHRAYRVPAAVRLDLDRMAAKPTRGSAALSLFAVRGADHAA